MFSLIVDVDFKSKLCKKWVHQDQHQRKICSEDPKMVKQIVSGCPEENKAEMKSNQVQISCSTFWCSWT